MNYLILLAEVILILSLMILFYKMGNKNGLFFYISLLSSILSVIIFKSIDIFGFEVQLGIPLIIGIFACSNIIIQRYGQDETKKIILSFVIPYATVAILLSLVSLVTSSEQNLEINNIYNSLFGYNLDNIRIFIGGFLSVSLMLWYNASIYYYIRKSKNKYLFSNIGSMLVIQFLESIIFVLVSYAGLFEFNVIFGMIFIRYIIKILVGLCSLLPISIIMKMKVE